MGEGLYSKENKKGFASQLEENLRDLDKSIDLVNLAYSGYNTWQEHLETARYLNSEPMHEDLPQVDIIISFGGIQDFWNFLRLLASNEKEDRYEYANG